MPYVAKNPSLFIGLTVGSGQCVALVEKATSAPPDRMWKRGKLVRGAADIRPGTAIATFDFDGRYGNHTDGRSHAAIYIGQNATGIQVIDQWVTPMGDRRVPHFASPRTIHWASPHAKHVHASNNGDLFYVVQ